MLDKIALLSDNFYKFLTSLSLIVVLYCASFSELFIGPYNNEIFEQKKELSRITAHRWMLEGVKKDLLAQLGDTTSMQYFYYFTSYGDTLNQQDSALQRNKYYYTKDLDSMRKRIVDSLNKVTYQILLGKSDINTYDSHLYHVYKNISIREITIWVLGILAFITFIFGMAIWKRRQNQIDKESEKAGTLHDKDVSTIIELNKKLDVLTKRLDELSNTISSSQVK